MNAKIKDRLFGILGSDSASGQGAQASVKRAPPEDIRLSPLQARLLSEFMLPNSAHAVARFTHCAKTFGAPITRVIRALKEQGLLVEPNDARARLCHGKDESDLRMLCLDSGLETTGSVDELVDRLLVIDRSGWLLGYGGELLQCSARAARAVVAVTHREQSGIERPNANDDSMWRVLKKHALQTAREGNLLRCRNVYRTMANHLLRRNRSKKALQALCLVCIFDLCGARNRGEVPGETGRMHSRFDGARASLAPALVQMIRNLARESMLSMYELREIFLGVSARLPIPKDERRLWAVLHLALKGHLDPDDAAGCSRVIQNFLGAAVG
jgi:hypothetical protein